MVKERYKLKEDFKSFDEGTVFVCKATYGDNHIDHKKLQTEDQYTESNLNVTEEELQDLFTVL